MGSSRNSSMYLNSGLSFDASLEVFFGGGPGFGSSRWRGSRCRAARKGIGKRGVETIAVEPFVFIKEFTFLV